MIVKYEFDTASEDFDRCELKRFEKALDMAGCIWDIQQKLRNWYKYDGRSAIPVEEIEEAIWDIIKDHNIVIDELYA